MPEDSETEVFESVRHDSKVMRVYASTDGSRMRIEALGDEKDIESMSGAPLQLATWQTISMIQIADIVGTGVLALGSAFAGVGWIPAFLLMFSFLPFNIYIGLMLSKLKQAYPGAFNSFKLSQYTVKNKVFKWIHYGMFYSWALGLSGAYLQTFAMSLRSIFINVGSASTICFWQWQAIGCIVLAVTMQVRSFHDGRILYIVNAVSIAFTVLIASGYMWGQMDNPQSTIARAPSELVATNLTWRSFVGSMSTFCFAYAGSPIYMELLGELSEPRDFPKTFLISSPYQLVFYLISAVSQYAFQGSASGGKITDALPEGSSVSIAANAFLATHMIVTFLCKAQIISRDIHLNMFRKTVMDFNWKGKVHWFICTMITLSVSFLVSNAVPNFNTLLELLGAFQTPYLGFMVPSICYFCGREKLKAIGEAPTSLAWAIIAVINIVAVGLLFLGTTSACIDVVDSWKSSNAPFSCAAM